MNTTTKKIRRFLLGRRRAVDARFDAHLKRTRSGAMSSCGKCCDYQGQLKSLDVALEFTSGKNPKSASDFPIDD